MSYKLTMGGNTINMLVIDEFLYLLDKENLVDMDGIWLKIKKFIV